MAHDCRNLRENGMHWRECNVRPKNVIRMDKSCMAGWVTFSAYTAREVDNISHKSSDFNRFVAVEMIKFSKSKIYLEKSFIITSTQVFSSTLHG